jgi:uridylate kinase
MRFPDAVRYASLTYYDVQINGLRVMDETAISLCKDNQLPILVFELLVEGNIRRVVTGEPIGTLVHGEAFSATDTGSPR